MAILLLAEPKGDSVHNVTLEILGKLSGSQVDVVSIGEIGGAGLEQLRRFGAKTIHFVRGTGLQQYSPDAYASAMHEFVTGNHYDFIFAGATPVGKDIFPRIAGMFDAALASCVSDFSLQDGTLTAVKLFFGGEILADVEFLGPKPWFVTVNCGALDLIDSPVSGAGKIAQFDASPCDGRAVVSEVRTTESKWPDLTEAEIVVSAGRGLRAAGNLRLIEELADVVGAAIGASGGAVGCDYAPGGLLVGQTGSSISPSLYIACGISGATHHMAGIRNAKKVLAINIDPHASIMRKADYAVVGDLVKVLPVLTERLKK